MDETPILPLTHCYVDLLRGAVIGPDATAQLSDRELSLLTHLAGRPGQCVSRDQLHEVVWGFAPTVMSRAVDTAMARLRKKLREPPRAPDHLISVHGEGYRFVPLHKPVDVMQQVAPAAAGSTSGPVVPLPDGALELGARRVVRGDTVVALGDREVAILDVLHRHLGAFVPRRALLEAAWNEPASARVVDAALGRLRAKLEVDPARPRVLVSAPRVGVRLVGATTSPLPSDYGLFVGRARVLDRVLEALEHHRLVTITGTGGIGKTRLAVRAAHALRTTGARVVWVELGSVAQGASPVAAVARAVGLDIGADDGHASLEAALAGTTLVLDNCEHVASAVGLCVPRWLERARVLATSRTQLRVDGEHRIPLQPLAGPVDHDVAGAPSVQVFVARARQTHPGFSLTPENTEDVRAIVAAVDGLPRALELAAARLDARSPAQLRVALSELDGSGAGDALSTTVQWSWNLLDDEDRRRLRRLAVFRGGFEPAAGEAVVGGELDRLLDHGFLFRADRRIRMYATTRAFLTSLGPVPPEAVAAHARWYARLGRPEFLNAVRCVGIEGVRFGADAANLTAALEATLHAGDGELAAACALGLLGLREPRGADTATIAAAATVLELELAPATATRLRIWLGRVRRRRGDFQAAAADFDAAMELARARGDAGQEGRAVAGLGWVRSDELDAAGSVALFRRALELGESVADDVGTASAHVGIALGCVPIGHRAQARDHAREAIRVSRRCGAARTEALGFSVLGNLFQIEGAFADAIDNWNHSRQLLARLGDRRREAATAQNLGLMYWYLGDYGRARDLMEFARTTLESLGLDVSAVLNNLANVARSSGDLTLARDLLRQAMARSAADPGTTHWMLTANLGRVDLLERNLPAARSRLQRAVDGLRAYPAGAAAATATLAEVEARLGSFPAAKQLAGEALNYYAGAGSPASEAAAILHAAVVAHLAGEGGGEAMLQRAAALTRQLGLTAGELAQSVRRVGVEIGATAP